MRSLRLFFWSGALAVGAYGLARLCLLDREKAPEATEKKKEAPAAAADRGHTTQASFTGKIEAVRRLKRENRHAEAITLLQKLLTAAEQEAARAGSGIAAWYYEQLAILYRKGERLAEEVQVLERYLATNEKLGGTPVRQLENRLARAKNLLAG